MSSAASIFTPHAFRLAALLCAGPCLIAAPLAQAGAAGAPPAAAVPVASRVPLVRAPAHALARRLAQPVKAQQIGVGVALNRGLSDGAWSVENGQAVWRLRVASDGAQAVALTLTSLRLPAGATLTWASADGRIVQGPYTRANVPADGTFFTPMVPGTEGVLTLTLPSADTAGAALTVGTLQHVYAMLPATEGDGVVRPKAASGACNVDTACPAGDAWRNEIRATVLYTIANSTNTGLFACSGSLLNNTALSEDPLLYSANHCTNGNRVSSVVVYFNFQKAACNGPSMSTANWSQTQSGASLLASGSSADYALMRLGAKVSSAYNVYFNAWNASSAATATSGSVIHHPSADVKKISLYNTPAQQTTISFNSANDQTWKVTYSTGTTEEGSSGSNLLNQNRQVIGTLSGGDAACSTSNASQNNGLNDYFGRLDVAYAESSAVRAALDPAGNGTATSACAKTQGVAGCVAASTVAPPATGSGTGTSSSGGSGTTSGGSGGGGGGALGFGLLAGLAGVGLRARGRRRAKA